MSKLCFKAWIKKEILNNGGIDNFIKCLSDGTIEYIGSDEIMNYILEDQDMLVYGRNVAKELLENNKNWYNLHTARFDNNYFIYKKIVILYTYQKQEGEI